MGYDKRANAKQYALKDGDTLQKIAERETAAGNKLTWQDLAKFNWGTDKPDEINRFLRDELGCYKRDDTNGFVVSADAPAKGKLLIPVKFKTTGLATTKTHTLKVRKQPAPPKQFHACARVKGVCFDFDSSFIRPSIVDDLKRLDQELKKYPAGKVMIFGHTDKVGPEEYNKGLSERRARSVYAFITNDADEWEKLYNDPNEKWGLKIVQTILKDLGHDPGPLDGVMGDKTRKAIKSFDPASSSNTADLRKKLFKAYMTGKHDVKVDPSQFMEPKHMGCSEFNPIVETEKPCEANRRVTFYIFNPDRLPKLPCKTGDLAPCRQQVSQPLPRHKASFHCSFYDSIAKDCPCEGEPPSPDQVFTLRWEPAKASCGDKVKLLGEINAPDGTAVKIYLTPKQGNSPKLEPVDTTVNGGKFEEEVQITNIAFDSGSSFLDKVELEAVAESGLRNSPPAILQVEALLDTNEETFSATRTWSGFTMEPKFKMKVEKFRCKVHPAFDIMKMWPAYRVNLSGFGVTGTVTNGPNGNGLRWARVTGTNPMMPDQYFNGTNWVAMPAGFAAAAATNSSIYSAVGFYQSGSQFVPQQGGGGGAFPTPFPDYNFNSATNVAKRDKWIKVTHDKWTDVFHLRRKDCLSDKKTRCCRYEVEINITFNVVTADAHGVVAVCEGNLRSNAGIWFMGDARDDVAAHESGHHMDNPDEYTGGAVDTTLSGDGAVNGIDADSIMGQNLTKVKKRHYHAFSTVLQTAIKNKYTRDYVYEAVDK